MTVQIYLDNSLISSQTVTLDTEGQQQSLQFTFGNLVVECASHSSTTAFAEASYSVGINFSAGYKLVRATGIFSKTPAGGVYGPNDFDYNYDISGPENNLYTSGYLSEGVQNIGEPDQTNWAATYSLYFERVDFSIIVYASSEDEAKGSVSPTTASVALGEPVTLIATPAQNYVFSGWRKNGTGDFLSTAPVFTFYPSASDHGATFVAYFTYNPSGLLLWAYHDDDNGKLIWDDKKVHCAFHGEIPTNIEHE